MFWSFHPLAYKTNNKHLPKPFFKVIRKSLHSKWKCVFHFFKAIVDTSSRQFQLMVRLVCTNGKRDSEPNFTSPEFCVPFAQAEDRLVNNQGNPLNFLVKDWAFCLFVCVFYRCGSEGPEVNTQNTLLVVPEIQKYEITSQLDFLLCVDWWNSQSVWNGLSRQGIQFPAGPFLESPGNLRAPKAGVFALKIEVF